LDVKYLIAKSAGAPSRGRGGGLRVCGKIDEEEIDYELDDLDSCDPFFPPDTDSTGSLEVVPVHDDVDGQIKSDWNITLQ
jgi:hypothetical protein